MTEIDAAGQAIRFPGNFVVAGGLSLVYEMGYPLATQIIDFQ
jgi:hypothetical protein